MVLVNFDPQIGILDYKLDGDLTLNKMANCLTETNVSNSSFRMLKRLFDATKVSMAFPPRICQY